MRAKLLLTLATAATVAACGTTPTIEKINSRAEAQSKEMGDIVENRYKSVTVTDRPYLFEVQQKASASYLEGMRLSLEEPTEPLRGTEIARMFKRSGINVVSSLPLDGYYYNGLGVTETDARTALQAVLGPMGLDYREDNNARLIEIIPFRTKTWNLSIGPRTTSYEAGGENTESNSSGAGGAGGGGGNSAGGSSGGLGGIAAAGKEQSKTKVSADEDFWKELKDEMARRMFVRVPRPRAPQQPAGNVRVSNITPQVVQDQQAALAAGNVPPPTAAFANGGNALFQQLQQQSGQQAQQQNTVAPPQIAYDEIQVGAFTMNPSTGAVTVQGPGYMLDNIGKYMDRVEQELNTVIVVDGKIILVTNSDSDSEGLELSAFKRFASTLGMVVTNNTLGGLTVALPSANSTAAVASASGALSTANLGILLDNNALQIFTAFMQKQGKVRTITEPHISTTSGVPATFSQFDRDFINTVSQTATASTTNVGVAAQNTIIPFQFGLSLRVNPRYDAGNELVRTKIALTQVIQSGVKRLTQIISGANGAPSTITTDVPLDRRVDLHGEMLVPNGALVIFGGQKIETATVNQSGITGTLDTLLYPILGNKQKVSQESTYYVALSIRTQDLRKVARAD